MFISVVLLLRLLQKYEVEISRTVQAFAQTYGHCITGLKLARRHIFKNNDYWRKIEFLNEKKLNVKVFD